MADNSAQSYQPSPTLQNLRALAQSHLIEIETDLTAEAIQQETMARDLQKYSKVRRNDRTKPASSASLLMSTSSPPPETDQATKSKPKLRTAQDVLDRLHHDPSLDLSEYRVGYLERFEGIKEMPARSWISESTDEDWIPQHRIRYVKRVDKTGREEVVWDRDARMDRVFGSGNPVNKSGDEDEDEDPSEFGGTALSSAL